MKGAALHQGDARDHAAKAVGVSGKSIDYATRTRFVGLGACER